MRRSLAGLSMILMLGACAGEDAPTVSNLDGANFKVADAGVAGSVYIVSNDASANTILVYPRRADGSLGAPDAVPTGGLGTGGGLGNQAALALSNNGRFLYAINAGSNTVSAFRITGRGLSLLGSVPSGGEQPISVALNGNLLYVLNDGGTANVTGFLLDQHGMPRPIAGSRRGLSTDAPDAAQVGISPDGRHLLVTEKATNLLVSWAIARSGRLYNRRLTPSASPTPFGFAFNTRGAALVSEAVGGAVDASVLSSYRFGRTGLIGVSPSTATTETAACWVAVTPNGRFAYVTNAGSASVSGFAVGRTGALRLLDADGVTGTTAATPLDAGISRNGRFLYTLDAGGHAISAFRIGSDGSLTHLGDIPGVPAGATGLVSE